MAREGGTLRDLGGSTAPAGPRVCEWLLRRRVWSLDKRRELEVSLAARRAWWSACVSLAFEVYTGARAGRELLERLCRAAPVVEE